MPHQRPVAVLFGTRPEAIKLAPVILALRSRGVPTCVISTGQHGEILQQVVNLFGIHVDHDLALMRTGQTLDYLLSSVVVGVGELMDNAKPRALVVQGDTTSTFGAALAAFHHDIPVAHVEAGLRSGNMKRPYPEEMNRRVTTLLSTWHFAPTRLAAENLATEGIEEAVQITGNTVVDAVRHILSRPAELPAELVSFIDEAPYILATAHRRESWHGGIARVATALREILDAFPAHRLVFATHPNPIARAPVDTAFEDVARARILTAVEYDHFLRLLQGSRLAITDSGGIQEEGPSLGIPVLVTRDVTERPEGVIAGAVQLVGTDVQRIVARAAEVLGDEAKHAAMSMAGADLYGDGHAADRIVDALVSANPNS